MLVWQVALLWLQRQCCSELRFQFWSCSSPRFVLIHLFIVDFLELCMTSVCDCMYSHMETNGPIRLDLWTGLTFSRPNPPRRLPRLNPFAPAAAAPRARAPTWTGAGPWTLACLEGSRGSHNPVRDREGLLGAGMTFSTIQPQQSAVMGKAYLPSE